MRWLGSVPLRSAVVHLLLEWITNAFFGYGIFVDELYFLPCAKRLAVGYVDHPPLSTWLLRAALFLGDSLPVLRFWPTLAGSAVIYLSARLAQRLGGTRRASWLAALATAGAPVLMVVPSPATAIRASARFACDSGAGRRRETDLHGSVR